MILGQSSPKYMANISRAGRATLDDMFRRAVNRHPDAIALADAPNRVLFTDGPPRRLTFAQADRVISAIAGRLRRLGLQTDNIVAFQIPNSVEAVLTLLGIIRAGLIAVPLPLLWRQADAAPALSQIGAKALITASRIGAVDHCAIAMAIAAETFQIRHVCAFGSKIPDGLIPFGDVFETTEPDPLPSIERPVNPAYHVAVVTWDVTTAGLVPIARNHFELLSAGIGPVFEGPIELGASILSTIALPSFAGIALSVIPWLMVGGMLSLHHSFDPAALAKQCKNDRPEILVVPAAIATHLKKANLISSQNALKTLISVWRTPERLADADIWDDHAINFVDAQVFGETAILASRRDPNGKPLPISLGAIYTPKNSPSALHIADIGLTTNGHVAIRSPMIPKFVFPPDAEEGEDGWLNAVQDGFTDTGFMSRQEKNSPNLVLTNPPSGIVNVGGYRFALHELQAVASLISRSATVAALPNGIGGQRLAANSSNQPEAQQELIRRGVNPLIVGAFRSRQVPQQSATG